MVKTKNPIDRFIYGIRDGWKNVKRAFAESEVVHKCITKFLPANQYSKKISDCAIEITNLLETKDVISTDKEFNTFYRFMKDAQPGIKNEELLLQYIFNLIYNSCIAIYPKMTQEQFNRKGLELLQKPDCDLDIKDQKIMREVLDKLIRLKDNIKFD